MPTLAAFAPSPFATHPFHTSSSFIQPLHRVPSAPLLTHSVRKNFDTVRCVIPNSPDPSAAGPNRSLANLHELTERIADLLQVGNINTPNSHCPKDAPLGYLTATTHVAVVFGKHLVRDQITVEFAKRIVTLVKQIASGALTPDVICFTGGKGINNENCISEASAGYSFFRNLCEEANIDVSRFDFILEEQSRNTKGNLRNVIEELRRRSGSDAVSACHFTLVSSDYHLIRIQEVHRLSPRQSILFPLEVSNATWNCIFAAYPFCVSRDPATAFLGRAVVLANDLGILLVNLNGALDDREFVAKENIHRLNETFAKMREMYRVIDARSSSQGGFRRDMRTHAETLELAIHHIREVYTLLSPLEETGCTVPRPHLELAKEHLMSTIKKMRSSMDPDRILRVHDRLAIIEDMTEYVAEVESMQASGGHAAPSDDSDDSFGDGPGHNAPTDEDSIDIFADENDISTGGKSRGRRKARRKSTNMVSNEIQWQGGTMFKGNGKRITRDGPNLVIADSSVPAVRPQSQRRARPGRRTVANSDTLAGHLASALTSNQPPSSFRSTPSAPGTRPIPSTQRKTRQASTSKKRKTTSRKLAQPSAGGEAA